MTTPTIDLPDNIAKEARNAGLLTPDALAQLLKEAVRRQAAGVRPGPTMHPVQAVSGGHLTLYTSPCVVPNDIDDDQVIACTLVAGAKLIVSGDNDLLVLHPWRGIQILNVADALRFVVSAKMEN